jgi:RND family efflux transporter MFP subunit
MNHWIDMLNGASGRWAPAMLDAAWRGGIVLALVWAVCLIVPRLPGRWRCWLWRLAFLKLLIALVWTMPLDLPLLPAPLRRLPVPPVLPAQTIDPVPGELPVAIVTTAGQPHPSRQSPSAQSVPLVLWTLALALYAARLANGWRRTVALRRESPPVTDTDLQDICAELGAAFGVRRAPHICMSDAVTTPLVLGFWQPTIVLPRDVIPSPAAIIRMLLAHELAHVRRNDLLWNWLPAIATGLFWFHPLVWVARRQSRLAQESACDELAIAATSAAAVEYGQMLVNVADSIPPRAALAWSMPRALAVGAAESRWILKRRLIAMRHFQTWTSRRSAGVAVVVIIAAVGVLVPWRVVAQQQPPQQQQPSAAPLSKNKVKAGASLLPSTTPPAAPANVREEQYAAQLTAATTNILAPHTGVITAIHFQEGQLVNRNDELFILDDPRVSADAREAKVKLDIAQQQFTRIKKLNDSKAASDGEVAAAEAQVRLAESALDSTTRAAEGLRVQAPFSGALGDFDLRTGETVQQGQVLTSLVEVGALRAEFYVPQAALAQIHMGTKIKFALDASGPTYPAEVYFIAPQLDTATGTIKVKAKLIGDTASLRPGMYGGVTVSVPNRATER